MNPRLLCVPLLLGVVSADAAQRAPVPDWPRADAGKALNGSHFVAVTPCRLADTRPTGGFSGDFGPPALAAGVARILPVAGQCGIPSTARAVSANFTVTETTGLGFLSVWPSDEAMPDPLPSSVNFIGNQTLANAVVAPLGADGGISIVAGVSGSHFILDVNGYYEPVAAGAIGAAEVNAAEIQRRVSEGCPAGQRLRGINVDGTVTCEAVVGTLNGLSGNLAVVVQGSLTVTSSGNTITIATTPPAPQTRQVDCDAGQSINQTLAQLPKVGPNVVTVTGTCHENVLVVGYDDLILQAGAGGATILPGATPGHVDTSLPVAIEVATSRWVRVQGFTIQNTSNSLGIALNASVLCTVRGNNITGGSGVSLLRQSTADVVDNVILQFTGEGIAVRYSKGDLLGNRIENGTGWAGVAVEDGAVVVIDGLALTGTHFAGVYARDATVSFQTDRRGINVIGGTAMGLSVAGNAAVRCVEVPPTAPVILRITGTTINSVQANDQSLLELNRTELVTPGFSAIVLGERTLGRLANVNISGSTIDAIRVSDGASVCVGRSGAPTTISGSGGQDVTCDAYSLVRCKNFLVGATNVTCPNYVP